HLPGFGKLPKKESCFRRNPETYDRANKSFPLSFSLFSTSGWTPSRNTNPGRRTFCSFPRKSAPHLPGFGKLPKKESCFRRNPETYDRANKSFPLSFSLFSTSGWTPSRNTNPGRRTFCPFPRLPAPHLPGFGKLPKKESCFRRNPETYDRAN